MANVKPIGAWSRYVISSDGANVSMNFIWEHVQGTIAALCVVVTLILLAKRNSSEGTVSVCITDSLSEILYMFPIVVELVVWSMQQSLIYISYVVSIMQKEENLIQRAHSHIVHRVSISNTGLTYLTQPGTLTMHLLWHKIHGGHSLNIPVGFFYPSIYLSWFTQESSRTVTPRCLHRISLKTVFMTCVSLGDRQHPYAMDCRPMLSRVPMLGYA